MSTITTRAGKGSPLTNNEVDANFTNLNTDKAELSGAAFTGNITFTDNSKAIFGAGSDLQIYHDGLNSYIVDAGTGDLYFRSASNLYIGNAAGTQSYITAADGGAVDLRYNGASKLATTATGIDVTGTATMDGLEIGDNQWIYAGNGADLKIGHDGTDNIIRAQGSPLYIDANGTTFRGYSPYTKHMDIATNGDISFYEDTGTTAKFFWDASAESLGIGNTSPDSVLTAVNAASTAALRIGLNNTSYNYMDADNNIFRNGAGTERMRVDAAGNVGIGTNTPSSYFSPQLVVHSSSNLGGITIRSNATTDTNYLLFADGTSGNERYRGYVSYDHNADTMKLATGSSPAITIDSSQNVGIGTSSPSSELTIGADTPQIDLLKTSSADVLANIRAETDAGSGGKLVFQTKRNGDTALDRMTIDDDGNVGIGTSSPSTKLHLGGTAPGDSIIRQDSTASGTNWEIGERAAGKWQIFEDDTDSIVATFMSSGNVGIGTTSPAYKLDLNGDMRFTSTSALFWGDTNVYEGRTGNDRYWVTGGSERMRIDSSGNVGIGESSPAQKIHLRTSGVNTGARLQVAGGSGRAYDILSTTDGSLTITDANASSERMRIDSSGNLLVGKTAAGFANTGHELRGGGSYAAFTRDGGTPVLVNRKSSDGTLVEYMKDGTTVGSIKADAGSVGIGSGNCGLLFYDAGDRIIPRNGTSTSDNALDLGASTDRFVDIYATNGTIQTSDRNEKQDIAELSDAEQRVAVAAKGLLRKFRWKNAIAEKGDEARTHFGIIAQDLQAAFAAEGLDAGDYAMFISTTWTDEETNEEKTRMGVRYSELLAFIIAAI